MATSFHSLFTAPVETTATLLHPVPIAGHQGGNVTAMQHAVMLPVPSADGCAMVLIRDVRTVERP